MFQKKRPLLGRASAAIAQPSTIHPQLPPYCFQSSAPFLSAYT